MVEYKGRRFITNVSHVLSKHIKIFHIRKNQRSKENNNILVNKPLIKKERVKRIMICWLAVERNSSSAGRNRGG